MEDGNENINVGRLYLLINFENKNNSIWCSGILLFIVHEDDKYFDIKLIVLFVLQNSWSINKMEDILQATGCVQLFQEHLQGSHILLAFSIFVIVYWVRVIIKNT